MAHHLDVVRTFGLLIPALILSLQAARADGDYMFIVRARGNPYWNAVAAGIKDTAKERNIPAIVYQGESETSAEEQLNICTTALQRKPKFLAISATATSTGILCLKKAQEAGVKVAELDSSIPIAEAQKGGVELSFSVGSDNKVIGEKAAEYVAALLKSRDAKLFVLEGAVGSEPGKLRVEGFKEKLQAIAPQATIVASISAGWDRLKAMNTTTDLIQRFPDVSLIYAANDQMALGAVEALKAQGMLGKVAVLGVDGTADARDAVVRGDMIATVAQLPYFLGKRAVELSSEVVQGKAVSQRELTDTPILTREVLLAKDNPLLKYIR